MKRWLLPVIFIVGVFLVCAGCTQSSPSVSANGSVSTPTDTTKKVYVVGIDGDYFPFSYIDKNGMLTGFDVESIQWIAKDQGFDVQIQPMAWDGIIPALRAKKIDMVYSGMTKTPERMEQVNFSKTYWGVNQAIVARNSSTITMDNFITGKVIVGTQRGSSANTWLENNLIRNGTLKSTNLTLYDNFPLALTDLSNGRTDVVMFDVPVVVHAIKNKPIKKIGIITTDEAYGVAVRKDDTALLAAINTGLDHLMASDRWKELIQKYDMQ
ncbi:ABC transporter substrate-binding protein [Methanoregula sp.]|uniref:ABC transporter substrate-binding protein n=1 Tax=Methanoregula sp. TaxID=2052170 RepID=UPI003561D3EB